jgi:hypothetical protein
VQQERRKFLAQTERGSFLLKFAGLGEDARKLARGRLMSEAALTPAVVAHRHGFLVERWIADATPLDAARVDRAWLVETVGRYLAFRAGHFPAAAHRGASLAKLVEMARHNATQALGPGMAGALDALVPSVRRLEREVRPVEIDGRMHPWEWLVRPDGSVLKTDGLDHHAGHDLVGCQDVAWDVIGAKVELALTDAETRAIGAILERETGRPVAPELLRLYEPCYLAFHLGAQTLAARALVGFPAEAERLRRSRDRYGASLKRALSPHCRGREGRFPL